MADRIYAQVTTRNGYADITVDGEKAEVQHYDEGVHFVQEDAGPAALQRDYFKAAQTTLDTVCAFRATVSSAAASTALAAIRSAQREAAGTTSARLAETVRNLERCTK